MGPPKGYNAEFCSSIRLSNFVFMGTMECSGCPWGQVGRVSCHAYLENWSLGSSHFPQVPGPSGLGISLTLFCFSGTCALKKRDGARTLRFSGVWGVGSPVPTLTFQHWSTEQKKKNKKPKDQTGRPTALRLSVCPSVYPTTRLCVVSVKPLLSWNPATPASKS